MVFIKTWLTNIVVFILLATIFDMLLPRSTLQKYTKVVIGLLLLTIIITPIFSLVKFDADNLIKKITQFDLNEKQQTMENSLQIKKKEIETANDAYILEQMAVQLKNDFNKELINEFNVLVTEIQFNIQKRDDDESHILDNIDKLVVITARNSQGNTNIDLVEIAKINPSVPTQMDSIINEQLEIANFLTEKWPMFPKIEVILKGD